MKEDLTPEEQADVALYYISEHAGEDWHVLMNLIEQHEQDMIEQCISSEGDKGTRAKGGALSLRAFKSDLECSIENGFALVRKTDTQPDN